MQVKSIQRNTPIFFYGDKDEQIYYVLKGSVQLFIPKSEKEIWDEVDFNRRLKNASNDQKVLEEKDRFDIVINAIQKMKGSHIDLIKQNDKLKKKYFDENYQVSKIKKIQQVKAKQMFGEISYLLEKPRPYTAIASEECYCVIFEPKIYRRALGEYFSFINCKNIYLNNYFSSMRKETIFHLSISFNQETKLQLGDYLFREGDQGSRIYLLKQGKIEFQKRLASSSSVFHQKRKNLQKLKQKQTQQKKNQKSSFTMQSLTKLIQLDEQDDTQQQQNNQSFKRSNKKKKTFQIQEQEQPSSQDSLTEIHSNKKTYDQLNVSTFGTQDQMQSIKIASMVQFEEFDKNDTQKENLIKQNENLEQNDNADKQDDFKYKDVSLGIIQQGEFFGFEDILISSQNNYSQNVSQNRRTYSAKVISSDAIVFSIERSTFLKMLSQNENRFAKKI
ncbi:cyclic nucleotide-binding domain protein (macronuclear) [Tetrahymena thermophila SB210]|uniref:Cyclic nucleotide-binding domain protein n=1 Tax=Tetrahymena thermophila (strain SB210) TaxID=312017 RepID=I7M293_TETTS|nr:cyclic nucleotide-binding domain protein [Tetrahymena thermophila SB210]EAR99566.2 cyclic nucleotide-binding domain protein [Tetrahymena thermophila SB210]|eukprot:XP_001019811.2 cyclic nucleotide-binding domain protein [Tetrahymena thermophila SB210]